ncbi:MAG: NYN domain-containing protein [Campylobacterales bacterium]|nr:NYN domain-containing protein [Campylobacterales bacterium]
MNNKKIAVFFDCENISSKYVDEIYAELVNHGEVIIKQAYKDFSSTQCKSWNQELFQKFSMETINNSDIDTIVLVSRDSDFTDLAMHIKAKGLCSIGFGEKKTNEVSRLDYSIFFELPILNKDKKISDKKIVNILKDGVNNNKDDSGFASVAQIGTFFINKSSSLNISNYGFKTWGDIYKHHKDIFDIDYTGRRNSTMIVKIK